MSTLAKQNPREIHSSIDIVCSYSVMASHFLQVSEPDANEICNRCMQYLPINKIPESLQKLISQSETVTFKIC